MGEELPQVILDTRAQNSVSWKSAVLLYDNTFDRDMISRCVNALSKNFPSEVGDRVRPLSLSVYKIKVCFQLVKNRHSFHSKVVKYFSMKNSHSLFVAFTRS